MKSVLSVQKCCAINFAMVHCNRYRMIMKSFTAEYVCMSL